MTNTENLMDNLKASDPDLYRRIMDGMTNQIIHGVAKDLQVPVRTARAALRTLGMI